ncbi:MAG: hypothetical protein ACP5JG_14795 [Anaerolineae bacterium]
MFRRKDVLLDPLPAAIWEVWYGDTFDRETPRSIQVSGVGLMAGLAELWSRHLFDTVQPNGTRGFSAYNLWWVDERRSIAISGPWEGQTRLRLWIYGGRRRSHRAYANRKARALMEIIAHTHATLTIAGRSGVPIIEAAVQSATPEDLKTRLLQLPGI